ncbi:hypothetical protein FOA52_001359 [Chlamydomonas sp. UWO 241]|nr:hypothetical protein FOA52_001359 [Chlamydomonas sp. UWO 241]
MAGERASEPSSVAAAAAEAVLEGTEEEEEEDEDSFTCCICCEPRSVVALGACNHDVCARCSLRMRLCYGDTRCPLCKAVNTEVVVCRLPPVGPRPTFAQLTASRGELWARPMWARGVLVADDDPGGPGGGPGGASASGGGTIGGGPGRGGRGHVQPLHSTLMAMTARACSVCDRRGRRHLRSDAALQEHVRGVHGKSMCAVCLSAGARFYLELDAHTERGLGAHMASAHPRCEFCDVHFYGVDEQYKHMNEQHYACHVCQTSGARHPVYQRDAFALRDHMAARHHLCTEPECADCLVAFATDDELRAHYLQRHSRSMPRWDNTRSRPMVLDLGFATQRALMQQHEARGGARGAEGGARGAEGAGRGGGRGDRQQRGGRGGRRSGSANDNGAGGSGARDGDGGGGARDGGGGTAAGNAAAARARDLGDTADTDGGLMVIDDDDFGHGGAQHGGGEQRGRGRGGDGEPFPGAAAGDREHHANGRGGGSRGGQAHTQGNGNGSPAFSAGAWSGRGAAGPLIEEDFPSLSAAAAAAAAFAPWSLAAGNGGAGSTGVTLQKASSSCSCGRRVEHYALRAGEAPPSLLCDRACEAAARRRQLADAFAVRDPDTHVPSFDRTRQADFSPALLAAAQQNPGFWEGLERQLGAFFSDSSARRVMLAAMPQPTRVLVYQLVEAGYGLSGVATGAEPHRAITLYKSASSGVPARTLSSAAAASSREAVAGMAVQQDAEALRLTLAFTDVAPGTDLAYFMREWAGEFELAEDRGAGTAAARFTRDAPLRSCLGVLGGGVRGVFRVARAAPPPPAAVRIGPRPPNAAAALAAAPAPRPQAAQRDPNNPAPTDRWLVVQKGGKQRGATGVAAPATAEPSGSGGPVSLAMGAAPTGPLRGPACDPWADEQKSVKMADAAFKLVSVADDWEAEMVAEADRKLDMRRGLDQPPLEEANVWAALEGQEDMP